MTISSHIRSGLCLVLLLLASSTVTAQSTDIQRAADAYNAGDYATAIAIWEPYAHQGNREAQYAMGVVYFEGNGVSKNLDEALAWFRKAANSGHPTAMFNLGVAYWQGRGLTKNFSQAVDWWERAAESGDVASQYNLGLAYYLGKGAEKDIDKARNWLARASEQGHADANRVLGIIGEKDIATQSAPTTPATTASSTTPAPSAARPEVTQAEPTEQKTKTPVIITTRFRAAEVALDKLALRSAPSSQSPVIHTLRQGTPVKIVQAEGPWGRVEIPGPVRLWVFGDYVQGAPDGRVSADQVRLRTRPTTGENSRVAAHLNKGDAVTVHSSTGDWKHVSSRTLLPLWVQLSGLSEQNPVTQGWLDNFNALSRTGQDKPKVTVPDADPPAPAPFRAAWIKTDETAVVGRPAADAPVLNLLAKDTPIKVIGSKDDWLMIQSPMGLDVWVFGKFISETGARAQINDDRVRIRSLPSTGADSDVLGLLDKGTAVDVKSRKGDWIRLRVTSAVAGWVDGTRLTTPGAVSADWQERWDAIRSEVAR
ncbi:MAG: SH3 domain-containing protein [Arenicellales bacterium]|nr:SH3 domain-containing protein [Arenicellales bacterium]